MSCQRRNQKFLLVSEDSCQETQRSCPPVLGVPLLAFVPSAPLSSHISVGCRPRRPVPEAPTRSAAPAPVWPHGPCELTDGRRPWGGELDSCGPGLGERAPLLPATIWMPCPTPARGLRQSLGSPDPSQGAPAQPCFSAASTQMPSGHEGPGRQHFLGTGPSLWGLRGRGHSTRVSPLELGWGGG